MAEQMLVEGNAAVIAGDLMTARMHYTNAVKADPENVIAVQKRAMVNNQLGFYSDALEDAQKALSLSPSSAQAEYQAGLVRCSVLVPRVTPVCAGKRRPHSVRPDFNLHKYRLTPHSSAASRTISKAA